MRRRYRVKVPSHQELDALPPDKRLELISQARAARHQMWTTAGVVLTVLLSATGLYLTQKTLVTTQESQITDRYTKTVEQLGSGKREVRTAAAYALERIARDSPRDRPAIRDVLAAFVRERDPGPKVKRADVPAEPDTDVAAALTVLARRPADPTGAPNLDLHGVRLFHASLPWRASLSHADLREADLRGADLVGANLTVANLSEADLRDADLHEADLRDADLFGANLRDADLFGADLREANLRYADLSRTKLRYTDLSRAYLTVANLRDANLSRANLNEAKLSRTNLSGATLIHTNLRYASLNIANLRGASLFAADLRNAVLSSADLRDADLRYADLRGADLSGADLRGARGIDPEQVRKVAAVDKTTKFG
ncbi:pentapeptide repeat-containing protein [Actinomadura kijaniata]|uniref:pentapeptide repeat-containing protein n=1 Tax=Actinomadura kijaniata TaxID=46161 RepID=UPI003F1A7461